MPLITIKAALVGGSQVFIKILINNQPCLELITLNLRNIFRIYIQTELQLNKGNTKNKEISFFLFKYKSYWH